MTPLRIAFLCNEYPPGVHGGIGSFTRNLGRMLVKAGHHVRVVGCYSKEQCSGDFEDDCGVKVLRLPWPEGRFSWIKARRLLFKQVRHWARHKEIDVVELPDWQGWGAMWSRMPIPMVVRLHGSATYFNAEAGKPTDRLTRFLERSSLNRADAWASSSKYTAARTSEVFELRDEPLAIIYNSVVLRENVPVSARNPNQIVFSGTLTQKKGVISLIEAWPIVLRDFPKARLHFYGKDGLVLPNHSMREHLMGLLDEDAQSSVVFHGHQSFETLMDALNQARAAVFPSYAEAFALAPLESMACGCPTIYSERGSGPELIQDGENGLLVDPDNREQIAEAIKRVLGDEDFACRIGNAGHKRIEEKFRIGQILPENEKYFSACIEKFRQKHG